MEFKANVALVFKGDRIRRGQVIEASAQEVAHLGSDVSPVGPLADAPADEEAAVALEDMNLGQLKERAKELGLSAAGSKADLQERIALHLQSADAPADEEITTGD